MALTLVWDRTQADADRVRYLRSVIKAGTATADDITEYMNAPKGSYCAADLNRVGTAYNTLAGLLAAAGYPVGVTLRDDWTNDDEFLATDMTDYLAAIATIRSALAAFSTTPATPSDVKTWQQANAVEKIIADVETLYYNMVEAYYYLGDLYMGEV